MNLHTGISRIFLFILMILCYSNYAEKTLFDTMERQCGGIIQLSSVPTKSFVLMLTSSTEYPALFDCHVTVVVTEEARIHLSFLEMDIRSFGACTGDFLTILDSEPITEDSFYFRDSTMRRYCGAERPNSVASTGHNVTIRFVSDAHVNGAGFSLLLTAFHQADCLEDEFRCDNNRCIDNRLECDDYDNCGDGSDHNCHLPVYVVASIAVVSIVVLLAGLFLIVVWRYRCRQKRFESEESNNENNGFVPA